MCSLRSSFLFSLAWSGVHRCCVPGHSVVSCTSYGSPGFLTRAAVILYRLLGCRHSLRVVVSWFTRLGCVRRFLLRLEFPVALQVLLGSVVLFARQVSLPSMSPWCLDLSPALLSKAPTYSLASLLGSAFVLLSKASVLLFHPGIRLLPVEAKLSSYFCVNRCREKLVLLSSHRIKRLEDSWFKLLSHGDFLNASTRCSLNCLWGHKLILIHFFVISLAQGLASIALCFRCGS
jgi:hypothetical protein